MILSMNEYWTGFAVGFAGGVFLCWTAGCVVLACLRQERSDG